MRVMAEVLEGSRQDVGEHVSAQVADMRVAVDGRAAGVDLPAAGFERAQLLLAPGHRVVEADGGARAHGPLSMLPVVRALRLKGASASVDDIKGRVLVHDLSHELRKGSVLRSEDLEAVRRAGEIHVIELEPGDVHEDAAATRLAAGPSGPGLEGPAAVASPATAIAPPH